MTKTLSQALVFLLAVLFILSVVLPAAGHSKNRPALKRIGFLCMIAFSLLLAFCLLSWFGSL